MGFSWLENVGFNWRPRGPQSLHRFSTTKHPPLATEEQDIDCSAQNYGCHLERKLCFKHFYYSHRSNLDASFFFFLFVQRKLPNQYNRLQCDLRAEKAKFSRSGRCMFTQTFSGWWGSMNELRWRIRWWKQLLFGYSAATQTKTFSEWRKDGRCIW